MGNKAINIELFQRHSHESLRTDGKVQRRTSGGYAYSERLSTTNYVEVMGQIENHSCWKVRKNGLRSN